MKRCLMKRHENKQVNGGMAEQQLRRKKNETRYNTLHFGVKSFFSANFLLRLFLHRTFWTLKTVMRNHKYCLLASYVYKNKQY